MSEPLQLTLTLNLKDGQEAAFQELADTVPALVHKTEPGTVEYLWLRVPGTNQYTFVDRYASSEAFLTHLAMMQEEGHLDAVMAAFDIERVTCAGTPTDAAREALDGLGTVYLEQVAGFSRIAPGLAAI